MRTSTYTRVLPRDLFNEGNLLKCLGRLWIILESERFENVLFLEESVDRFDVAQDDSDGSLSVRNITLNVRGLPHRLWRPLNSREPWPLFVGTRNGEYHIDDILVLNNFGDLTDEAREYFTRKQK